MVEIAKTGKTQSYAAGKIKSSGDGRELRRVEDREEVKTDV